MTSGRTNPWASLSQLGGSGTAVYGQQHLDGAINFSPLVDFIDYLSVLAKSKIAQIRSEKSAMSIADMFDMQLAMNKLSQGSEMSTGIISAMQTASMSIARNLK